MLALALTVAVSLLAAGCAISVDQTAREVPNPPSNLLNTTTASTAVPGAPFTLVLYFLNEEGQLVRVFRPRDTEASTQDALTALAQPSDDEIAKNIGLNSKLGPLVFTPEAVDNQGVLPLKVEGDALRGFTTTDSDRVTKIYTQIVCTVVALDSHIKGVQIFDSVGAIPVVVGDAPVTRPVGPGDFNQCTPARPPSTTTTTRRPFPATTAPETTADPATADPATGPSSLPPSGQQQ